MAQEFAAAGSAVGQDDAPNARMPLAKSANVVGHGLLDVLVQGSRSFARGHHVPEAKAGVGEGLELLLVGNNVIVLLSLLLLP